MSALRDAATSELRICRNLAPVLQRQANQAEAAFRASNDEGSMTWFLSCHKEIAENNAKIELLNKLLAVKDG